MSNNMEVHGSGGLGLTSILTIIFVVAKLFGVINWPWLLVFSPVLISLALVALLLIIVTAIGALVYFGGN